MTLVFATHNPNKLKEVQALMPDGITLKSLTDIGCTEDITEDAPTIKGNAILKARYVLENYNMPCFADDTGLLVDALDGAPGVYSARYAGAQKSSEDNMNKLLIALAAHKDRSARFKTVIAFAVPEDNGGEDYAFAKALSKPPAIQTFEGICEGEITHERCGNGGFGYDPIFKPDGYDSTFAQMALALKGKISHRGRALTKFLTFLGNHKS